MLVKDSRLSNATENIYERRSDKRRLRRLNWGKTLNINDEFLSECIIANSSRNGACLRILRFVYIPQYFLLYIDNSSVIFEGEVIWRNGRELGCKLSDRPCRAKSTVIRRMRDRYYEL